MPLNRSPRDEHHSSSCHNEPSLSEYGSPRISGSTQAPPSHFMQSAVEEEFSTYTSPRFYRAPTRVETWSSCDYKTERDAKSSSTAAGRAHVPINEEPFGQNEVEYDNFPRAAPASSMSNLQYSTDDSINSMPRRIRHSLGFPLRRRRDTDSTISSAFSSTVSSPTQVSQVGTPNRDRYERTNHRDWSPEDQDGAGWAPQDQYRERGSPYYGHEEYVTDDVEYSGEHFTGSNDMSWQYQTSRRKSERRSNEEHLRDSPAEDDDDYGEPDDFAGPYGEPDDFTGPHHITRASPLVPPTRRLSRRERILEKISSRRQH